VDKELRRRGVTRVLLREEYRAANPDGFGHTWFCTTFKAWKGRARPTMRQTHLGGEKVFVDFAGDTIDIFDPVTGEAHAMKLFVAAALLDQVKGFLTFDQDIAGVLDKISVAVRERKAGDSFNMPDRVVVGSGILDGKPATLRTSWITRGTGRRS
jgi:hypothetical protein